jgi:hypothetical protein
MVDLVGVGTALAGGLSGLVSLISGFIKILVEVAKIVATYVYRFLRWYGTLLVEKPEYGVTLTLVIAYLLS